jgi:epoxyqueuosine reductase
VSESAKELGDQVVRACLSMGFALAGIAPAEPSLWRREYLEWLDAGLHGDMGYLAEMIEERLDVRRLLPGARAVIVVADQYAPAGAAEDERLMDESEPHGRIARYARGRDYHAVIKKRLYALSDRLRELHPAAKFRSFTDTGPALEREHAARANLKTGDSEGQGGEGGGGVFIGKHTLAIHPRLGSYLLLGGIATTLEIEFGETSPDVTASRGEHHCGSCTLCIEACPTGAITPYRVDATRCVSYLTLEHRGAIDPALHAGVGDRLIGCDVCQDVCPYNRGHEDSHGAEGRVNAAYRDDEGLRARLPILDVLGWNEADRLQSLGGSAAKRASLLMLRRNALVIAGNALLSRDQPELRERIGRIAADSEEDAMLRQTASQVLARVPPT